MIQSLLGEISLNLFTDKSAYAVGESPTYTLLNAEPGSRVLWSSFKNGKATQENRTDYGNIIGPLGGVELPGGAWSATDVGRWEKIAYVVSPLGVESVAQVYFNVQPVAATVPNQPAAQSWFDEELGFDFMGEPLTKGKALLGAGVIGVIGYALTKGK